MKILVMGAGGFIGTNLTIELVKRCQAEKNRIIVYDQEERFFKNIKNACGDCVEYRIGRFDNETDFNALVKGIDIIFHLCCTTIPATSNKDISNEIYENVCVTSKLLDACVREKVGKVVFLSSGGAVYGAEDRMPIKESANVNPISSYGIQKITIEKLLHLYHYLHGIDYRIIRMANPYGPYQRPNNGLGVVTTFIYNAINDRPIIIYGDGEVVRDFIYIDDAVNAILEITNGEGVDTNGKIHKVFNVGSGIGISVNEVVDNIKNALKVEVVVEKKDGRKADVPKNYLDIGLYEEIYGKLIQISMKEGIQKTADFLKTFEKVDEV